MYTGVHRARHWIPRAEVPGSHELLKVCAGKPTWILCKSRVSSSLMSLLSSPKPHFLRALRCGNPAGLLRAPFHPCSPQHDPLSSCPQALWYQPMYRASFITHCRVVPANSQLLWGGGGGVRSPGQESQDTLLLPGCQRLHGKAQSLARWRRAVQGTPSVLPVQNGCVSPVAEDGGGAGIRALSAGSESSSGADRHRALRHSASQAEEPRRCT